MPYKQRIPTPCLYIPCKFLESQRQECSSFGLSLTFISDHFYSSGTLYHWLPVSSFQILNLFHIHYFSSEIFLSMMIIIWLKHTFHFYFNSIRKCMILFINWSNRSCSYITLLPTWISVLQEVKLLSTGSHRHWGRGAKIFMFSRHHRKAMRRRRRWSTGNR